MADKWFRFYNSARHSRKVNGLSPICFRCWVLLLTIASENDGKIPKDLKVLGFELRMEPRRVQIALDTLIGVGLLIDIGEHFKTPDWEERQFTAERMQQIRHRDRREALGLPRNRWINPKVREAVYRRDGFKCRNCGSVCDLTIDHIVSELSGGQNTEDNMQTLCRPCNARKRDMPMPPQGPHKGLAMTESESKAKSEQKESPSLRSGEARAKGTRWPTDATVSEEWIEQARLKRAEHGLPVIDLGLEAMQFANYWASKAGKTATKLDWRKTWLNWATDPAKTGPRMRTTQNEPRKSAVQRNLEGVAQLLGEWEAEDDRCAAGETRLALPAR